MSILNPLPDERNDQTATEIVHESRPSRWEQYLLPAIGASIAVFLCVTIYAVFLRTPVYEPITFDLPQVVLEDGSIEFGAGELAFFNTSPIPVEANICSTDPAVDVIGSKTWTRTDVDGRTFVEYQERPETLMFTNECDIYRFSNVIPDRVLQEAQSVGAPTSWVIEGVVKPTKDGGRSSIWYTEQFWILP